MKIHPNKLTGVVLSALLLSAVVAHAQRRGVREGGGGQPPAAGIARPQPQVNIAPPQNYNPPAGNDNGGRRGYTPPQNSQPNNTPPPQRGDNNNNNAGTPQRGSYNGNTQPRVNTYPNPQVRRGGDAGAGRPRGWVYGRPGNIAPGRLGANRVYRVWPGLPYGRNYITVRPQGIYHVHRGYFGSYYAPRIGLSVDVLPYGYYPFYYGPSLYYYSDGFYYQQQNNTYTVVDPPIGAEVKTLPDNAQSIVINGVQYYELNGVYYRPITKDDGSVTYEIAGKDGQLNTDDANMQDAPPVQVGDLVDSLPEECRKITLNGQKYYVTPDGYYLQDAVDDDGNAVYKIISVPTDPVADEKK